MNRRNTHQKELILQIVEGVGKHLTAEEVLQKAQEIDPAIGLATVYRNLNLFCDEKRIQKINLDGFSYYDGNPIPHHHFICKACGKLEDLEMEYNPQLDKSAKRCVKGTILHHSITFEGYCNSCINNQEEKTWN